MMLTLIQSALCFSMTPIQHATDTAHTLSNAIDIGAVAFVGLSVAATYQEFQGSKINPLNINSPKVIPLPRTAPGAL